MAWQPDDSFLEKDANGEMKGAKAVKQALAKYGRTPNGLYTSQDQDVEKAHQDLAHAKAAPGFQQWQLPVILGPNNDVLAFKTVASAGAKVPSHSHSVDVFRIIVSGSATYNGMKLSAGDWMVIPAGEQYELEAANNPGYVSFHLYW